MKNFKAGAYINQGHYKSFELRGFIGSGSLMRLLAQSGIGYTYIDYVNLFKT
ncbi:hypothetical protein BH23BAC3_BH23BAC3_22540 [soil metagenome]